MHDIYIRTSLKVLNSFHLCKIIVTIQLTFVGIYLKGPFNMNLRNVNLEDLTKQLFTDCRLNFGNVPLLYAIEYN